MFNELLKNFYFLTIFWKQQFLPEFVGMDDAFFWEKKKKKKRIFCRNMFWNKVVNETLVHCGSCEMYGMFLRQAYKLVKWIEVQKALIVYLFCDPIRVKKWNFVNFNDFTNWKFFLSPSHTEKKKRTTFFVFRIFTAEFSHFLVSKNIFLSQKSD